MLPMVILVIGCGAAMFGSIAFGICFLMTPAEQRSVGFRPDDLSDAFRGKGGIISGVMTVIISLAFLAIGLTQGRIFILAPIGLAMGIASILRGLFLGQR